MLPKLTIMGHVVSCYINDPEILVMVVILKQMGFVCNV